MLVSQAVYYLQRACDYAAGLTACPATFIPKAPPAGLRMVSGSPLLRFVGPIPFPHMDFGADMTLSNYTDTYAQRAISHECLTSSTSYYTNSLPQQYCLRIRSQVFFPSCWDGVNLDSADHSSHVSHTSSLFLCIIPWSLWSDQADHLSELSPQIMQQIQ